MNPELKKESDEAWLKFYRDFLGNNVGWEPEPFRAWQACLEHFAPRIERLEKEAAGYNHTVRQIELLQRFILSVNPELREIEKIQDGECAADFLIRRYEEMASEIEAMEEWEAAARQELVELRSGEYHRQLLEQAVRLETENEVLRTKLSRKESNGKLED